jgi:hypothetical protein
MFIETLRRLQENVPFYEGTDEILANQQDIWDSERIVYVVSYVPRLLSHYVKHFHIYVLCCWILTLMIQSINHPKPNSYSYVIGSHFII